MLPDKYVKSVLEPLMAHPDSLEITTTKDDMGVLLVVTCHKEDMGTIIGKEGKSANAIRTLVRILGVKSNARIGLKITEPAI